MKGMGQGEEEEMEEVAPTHRWVAPTYYTCHIDNLCYIHRTRYTQILQRAVMPTLLGKGIGVSCVCVCVCAASVLCVCVPGLFLLPSFIVNAHCE